MTSDIMHKGVVESVEGQKVMVRITQASACSECHARGLCRASESRDKLIEVCTAGAADFAVGSVVTVCGSESQGMKAVWFSFGLPLLLMLAVLVGVMVMTGDERIAAASALSVLVPYFIGLFLLRDRMKKGFDFKILQH